jgi:hypothetical protein
VANPAIRRSDVCRDLKAVVIGFVFLLPFLRLVTVEAGHSFACVSAHFEFVHDGILLPRMALRALARRFHEFRVRLVYFSARPRALHQQRAYDQDKCNQDGDEDGSE